MNPFCPRTTILFVHASAQRSLPLASLAASPLFPPHRSNIFKSVNIFPLLLVNQISYRKNVVRKQTLGCAGSPVRFNHFPFVALTEQETVTAGPGATRPTPEARGAQGSGLGGLVVTKLPPG